LRHSVLVIVLEIIGFNRPVNEPPLQKRKGRGLEAIKFFS
jgi:hypothetical protein